MDDCTDGHLKIATNSILKMGFFLLIVRIANVLTELNVIPITLIKVNNYKVQSRFHRYEILPILESRRDNEEDYFFFFFLHIWYIVSACLASALHLMVVIYLYIYQPMLKGDQQTDMRSWLNKEYSILLVQLASLAVPYCDVNCPWNSALEFTIYYKMSSCHFTKKMSFHFLETSDYVKLCLKKYNTFLTINV